MHVLFPDRDPRALDLVGRMLQFNPGNRLTVEEALAHPFMSSLHNKDDEPRTDALFSFDFEREKLDKPRLQRLIFGEMLHFHPEEEDKLPPAPSSFPPSLPPSSSSLAASIPADAAGRSQGGSSRADACPSAPSSAGPSIPPSHVPGAQPPGAATAAVAFFVAPPPIPSTATQQQPGPPLPALPPSLPPPNPHSRSPLVNYRYHLQQQQHLLQALPPNCPSLPYPSGPPHHPSASSALPDRPLDPPEACLQVPEHHLPHPSHAHHGVRGGQPSFHPCLYQPSPYPPFVPHPLGREGGHVCKSSRSSSSQGSGQSQRNTNPYSTGYGQPNYTAPPPCYFSQGTSGASSPAPTSFFSPFPPPHDPHPKASAAAAAAVVSAASGRFPPSFPPSLPSSTSSSLGGMMQNASISMGHRGDPGLSFLPSPSFSPSCPPLHACLPAASAEGDLGPAAAGRGGGESRRTYLPPQPPPPPHVAHVLPEAGEPHSSHLHSREPRTTALPEPHYLL